MKISKREDSRAGDSRAGIGEEGTQIEAADKPAPTPGGESPMVGVEELIGAEEQGSTLVFGPRRIAVYLAIVLALVIGLYVALPAALSGLSDTRDVISDANPWWIAVALGINMLSFASYVALFRGVIGGEAESKTIGPRLDWSASYQITMAGLAATRLFSAAGAGGIALTYWALRRAGMARRDSACRMVAFLVLLYAVYLGTVVVCGVLLRVGLFPGTNPVGMTIVPAAIAGVAILIFALVSLIPQDVERRLAHWSRGYRRRAIWVRRLAAGPALVASGTRTAMGLLRHPSRGLLAVGGAVGFWASNIAVLWACFHAFGEGVPKAVLVQGFFVGMAANLLPFFPGGVGSVDAGMIGAFLAFGEPASAVIVSVLAYRVIAFWLPIPPGVVAYLQLRRTVSRWRAEGVGVDVGPEPGGSS
jgi:uncharacterized protein (TIRG00374 family)